MADVLFLVMLAGFFLLCLALVKACDRMIEASDKGDKSVDEDAAGRGSTDQRAAA